MSQNLAMNPQAKDYVIVNGSPVASDAIEDKAYFAITIPQGAWQYGQTGQGSLIYTLQNKLRTSSLEQTYASMVNNAIEKQLIDTGQATDVQTTNTQATATGTLNNTQVTGAAIPISGSLGFSGV